jgi:hypothetical protein
VTIINDKIGPTTENTISTDVSYTVPTSENFSLELKHNLFNLDINKLNPAQADPSIRISIINY